MANTKVGIYAGTFDPVHMGHLAFAEQAIKNCNLEKVFFLVEPRPRRKQGVRALEHREAMVRLATANQQKFGVIQLEQANFSVEETLPKLKAIFEGAQLHFMMGDDVFSHLNAWPHVEDLLASCSFIVGIRDGDEVKMKKLMHALEKTRGVRFDTSFIVTEQHDISSSQIRLAFKRGNHTHGLPPEIREYIEENGLYLSQD